MYVHNLNMIIRVSLIVARVYTTTRAGFIAQIQLMSKHGQKKSSF